MVCPRSPFWVYCSTFFYINDIFKSSGKLNPVMFADRIILSFRHKRRWPFFDMNCELNKISLWFKVNKFWLNLTKTKYPFLKMNNIAIEREDVSKFLGVLIDENLSWKQHISNHYFMTWNIFQINLFYIIYFVFKCKEEIVLPIFHSLFTPKTENKYNIRSRGKVAEPFYRKKTYPV